MILNFNTRSKIPRLCPFDPALTLHDFIVLLINFYRGVIGGAHKDCETSHGRIGGGVDYLRLTYCQCDAFHLHR